MKKNIQDVRKNIAERKKRKFHGGQNQRTRTFSPPQDEELHGFPPLVHSQGAQGKGTSRERTSYLGIQILLAALLFAVTGLGKYTEAAFFDHSEHWVTSQMQEEFPFAKVTAWYEDRFGGPLQLVHDAQEKSEGDASPLALPVNGTVTTSFQHDGKGIVMATDNGEEVKAVQAGTVIFAGNDPTTKQTVILQHEDGTKTIYGYLSDIHVYLYDHIETSATVGTVSSEDGKEAQFFFAIEKDEQYINPVEAMKVDESS